MQTNKILNSLLKKYKFLIASHRGYRTGNIIENTYLAFKAAVISGADILEIDISKSSDGILYAFHDGNELRLLNVEKNIKECSSKEIENFSYYNSIGNKTEYKVEKFEDLIKKLEKLSMEFEFLINIDRGWEYLEEVFNILEKYNLKERCIIKTPLKDKYINILKNNKYKFMYLPLIIEKNSLNKFENIRKDTNINVIGIEYSGNIREENLINTSYKDSVLWINSLRLSLEERVYKEFDDDNSIKNYPNTGWLKLYKKGFNIIQTDFPALVKKVRDMEEL